MNSGDQVADLYTPTGKRRHYRPREEKLIEVLASGTAKSMSSAMMQAQINPGASSIRRRFNKGGDLRHKLDRALEAANLGLPRALAVIDRNMDAKTMVTVAGEATEIEDHQAQLAAVKQVLSLHDRTGKLPQVEQKSTGASITVNVLVMNEK